MVTMIRLLRIARFDVKKIISTPASDDKFFICWGLRPLQIGSLQLPLDEYFVIYEAMDLS
jgi:hypothetical protein